MYCTFTRGKERSRRPQDIIEEVRGLAREGYKEITLLGQNVNSYGKDIKDLDYGLGDLLEDISKIDIHVYVLQRVILGILQIE